MMHFSSAKLHDAISRRRMNLIILNPNIKVTGNAEPNNIDLPEMSAAFSRVVTG
jgi:hypothetical protein